MNDTPPAPPAPKPSLDWQDLRRLREDIHFDVRRDLYQTESTLLWCCGGLATLLLVCTALLACLGSLSPAPASSDAFERGRCVGYAEVQGLQAGWTADDECILGTPPAGMVAESEVPNGA